MDFNRKLVPGPVDLQKSGKIYTLSLARFGLIGDLDLWIFISEKGEDLDFELGQVVTFGLIEDVNMDKDSKT